MAREPTTGSLINAMERQAEDERRLIRSAADARAAEVLAAADAECERRKAEALRSLDKDLAIEKQRIVGEAVMRARAERLRMKRRLLAEVFRRAAQDIDRKKTATGYPAALALLAAEARSAAGEPCDVTVQAEDGSVVARSPDGRRRVDNGLAARLGRAELFAEHEVARLLFGAAGAAPSGGAADAAAQGGWHT
jgi:vacuolar-type H+-ATPase subunit E/Vma4